MKQHITEDQYNDLSKKSENKWYDWALKHHYTFNEVHPGVDEQSGKALESFPTIGQMIEFLGDDWLEKVDKEPIGDGCLYPPNNKYFCDALWQAVKEVLEK